MATARATYTFPDQCSISVAVTGESSYPDVLQEITTRCRQLLRDTTADWNTEHTRAEG